MIHQFEIRLCPALQKKPDLPPINLNVNPGTDAGVDDPAQPKDPFAQPYNPNLHLGDLADEDGEEYAVLVSALRR